MKREKTLKFQRPKRRFPLPKQGEKVIPLDKGGKYNRRRQKRLDIQHIEEQVKDYDAPLFLFPIFMVK